MRRLIPVVAAIMILQSVTPASANEQAFAYQYAGTPFYDGFKGNQGIRTNPATVSGVSFVHPTQVDIGALGGDFIAIGTYNGGGTGGVTYQCANDYDPLWSIYVDYEIGGLYNCVTIAQDVYGIGDNPSFQIDWRYCPTSSGDRWVLWFDGSPRRCLLSSSHSGIQIAAGLETAGSTVDRNIDVKYTNVQENLTSGTTWLSFGSPSHYEAPNYSYQYVSSQAFNVYLAPLD